MNMFTMNIALFKATFICSVFLVHNCECTENDTERQQSREHKIHNIVLYPDKHSWCKTTAIVQVVGHTGCTSVKMDNNVCVGACFSYIVPRTVPETPGDVSPYCDSCQPGHVSWKKVSLECGEGQFKGQNLTKHVEFIHDCNCGTCNEAATLRLPTDEETSIRDTLLDEHSITSTTELNHTIVNTTDIGFKTILASILEKMNNEDENIMENSAGKGLHRNVWKSLLEKVETANSSIDSTVFNQLVNKVEEEMKVKFNYKRLKQALLKLKRYENITKMNAKEQESFAHLVETSKTILDSSSASPSPEIKLETASPMLHVSPHHLKPATSRTEISYENHRNMTIKEGNHTINQKP